MTARILTVGAAQMGPVARDAPRADVVARLLALMAAAKAAGCDLVVYPELALTTFFPRWDIADQAELDAFYETAMPNPATQPLFDTAARLGIGFYLGYAELAVENGAPRRYNRSILVDKTGAIIGTYRKVHLPGTADVVPGLPYQHLEKRYFDVGDLGFPVWRALGGIVGMCICNDRRWPETYRVMGMSGVEMILLGYNTPAHLPGEPEQNKLRHFHNHLPMQAGAYQNASWVVGVAKAGDEEGVAMIGQSCIIAPSGEIVALCATLGDELISHACDLDMGLAYKKTSFDFAANRRPEHYKPITERAGVVLPPK